MVTEEELKKMSPEQIAELQQKNCIFCHIVSGKVPSKKIFEDDKVLAFLDINPASPGHIVLVPKTHYSILPQIPEDEIGHLFSVAKKVSNALLKSLQAKGTNIFVANGAVAGQKAPHFMIHIIPRKGDENFNFIPAEIEISPEQVSEIKQKLQPKINQVFGLSVDVTDLKTEEHLVQSQPPDPQLVEEVKEEQVEEESEKVLESEKEIEKKEGNDDDTKDEGPLEPEPEDDSIDIDALKKLF